MRYIVTLAFASALTGYSTAAAAEDLSPSADCYQYLLAHWTPRVSIEPILDGISADPSTGNQTSLDQVAEFLVQHLEDPQFSMEDAKATLGLLTRTRSGRYRLVMTQVIKAPVPVVLKEMAREYVAENKSLTVDQYVSGTVDFSALREQYLRAALAVQPTDERSRALDAMRPGESMEKLIALLSPPQHVGAGYARVSRTLIFRRLLLYYRGAGRAVFALDEKDGWHFQAAVADPLAFEPLMPYRARAAEFSLPDDTYIGIAQITSRGMPAIRAAIEDSYRHPQVPVDFLDAAAEVLASNWQNSDDEIVEDTCAWIMRLLRKKGGLRYATLLNDIETRSHSLKLKKWASLTLGKVDGVPRAGYVAGSIPLEAWAKKYPSPYPDVTYINGRL